MTFKCALIVVEDMKRARKFYEELLLQKVILDYGENIVFEGDFALQTKSSWLSFIHKQKEAIQYKTNNFELYFEEENFDAFLERLVLYPDVEYVQDVTEYPWGQRVIRFYDRDKHIVEVGESMRCVIRRFWAKGLTVEEIAKVSQHPIEFVKSCIEE